MARGPDGDRAGAGKRPGEGGRFGGQSKGRAGEEGEMCGVWATWVSEGRVGQGPIGCRKGVGRKEASRRAVHIEPPPKKATSAQSN